MNIDTVVEIFVVSILGKPDTIYIRFNKLTELFSLIIGNNEIFWSWKVDTIGLFTESQTPIF